ncbi:MAG TPA: hypothetical protein VFY87_15690 [Geminicoccaceae bacterium]|nr:hypothetical protein [Geminicoccaceae bacterium]
MILRGAERLRAATAAEHATRHAAAAAVANERAAAVGAAATMAAAKKALALKTGAARLPVARPARNDPARAGSAALADRDLPRTPIAGLSCRPRAP